MKITMLSNYLFILLTICISCYGKVDVGKYLKICERNSPDVNDCLIDAIQQNIDTKSGGIPELGVKSMDPFVQDEFRVDYKNNQIAAKMIMKDVTVRGMKHTKVHDVRFKADEERFHLECDMTTKKVFVTGSYSGQGRFNALKINANGQFNTTMRDLVYTWKLDGKPEKVGDETYLRITSFYMRPDIGDMKSYVSGLFPDNPELTAIANDFGNRNWRLMYRELLPYAQENWNMLGTEMANSIFSKIPYDDIFPVASS